MREQEAGVPRVEMPKEYRLAETQVRLKGPSLMREPEGFSSAVLVLLVIGLHALIVFVAGAFLILDGFYAGGTGVIALGLLIVGYGLVLTWKRRRVTLDERGFRRQWLVAETPVWGRWWPLERVLEFRVKVCGEQAVRAAEQVYVRVRTPAGTVRDVMVYLAGGHRDVAERMAAEMNEVLGRLREKAGIVADDEPDGELRKWDALFTPVETGGRFAGECTQPEACRWSVEKEPGVLRFRRKAGTLFGFKICLAVVAGSVMVFLGWFLLVDMCGFREMEEDAPLKILMLLLVMSTLPGIFIGSIFAFILFFERFEKDHYQLTWRELEWRRYVQRGGGTVETLAVADCAAVEMYGCAVKRPSVGPMKGGRRSPKTLAEEEYRLAFYDTRGKSLAEIVGLAREEAVWMRGEVLAFLSASQEVAADTEVTETPEEKKRAKKQKNPLGELESGPGWIACRRKGFSWDLLSCVFFMTGMSLVMVPFIDRDAPTIFNNIPLILQTPLSQWDMDLAVRAGALALMAAFMFGLFGAFLWTFLGKSWKWETWRLDADGFRYTFRTLFARRRMEMPAARVQGFRLETREAGVVCRQWLVMDTAAGRMPLAQSEYDLPAVKGRWTDDFRRAAEAGNRVLEELGISADLPAETEENIPPAGARWRMMRGADGRAEFRLREPFPWGVFLMPVFLVGVAAGIVWLLGVLDGAGAFHASVQPQGSRLSPRMLPVILGLFSVLLCVCAAVLLGVNLAAWLRRRKKVLPGMPCLTVAVKNVGEHEHLSWQTPQSMELRLEPPPYALVAEDTHGIMRTLTGGLTQDEARWMRDEILRNF